MRLDDIDLQTIRILSRDPRTPYRIIGSMVGISTHAAVIRVKNMLAKGIIQSFNVVANPAIFGYEKECFLIVKNIDKTIKEQDLFKKISLLGNVLAYSEHLGGVAIFLVFLKDITQNKIDILTSLLKPATAETILANYKPPSMKILNSDLEIMKCLHSDPRMPVEDIAKEISLSSKTVARRLEKMRENHVLRFFVSRNLSSLRLTGYIEFVVLLYVNTSSYQSILERIYRELEEYLLLTPNWYQREVILATFFAANTPTINLILKRLESYDGVSKVESYISTSQSYHLDWLQSEIDKRISSQMYLSSSATVTETTAKDA